MKIRALNSLTGAVLVAITSSAVAQDPGNGPASRAEGLEEVVVSARRREESLQSVPQTVNVVTSEQMEKLNVQTFNEIQALVPGLTLSGGESFSTQATVRGVSFNPEASGNNPTVEFYLNDALIASNFLFQTLFDVGQFELLRGPQGTLRGRASPSGSVTLTTRRPDLSEMGVVLNATATDADAYKGDFALNIPIIAETLAVRVAGVYDENEGNQVSSIKEQINSRYTPAPNKETKAVRASVRFTPGDWADLNLMYQRLEQQNVQYSSVQSASLATGEAPNGRIIDAFDKLAIEDAGARGGQDMDILILNADVRFAGQKLSYVGSYNKQDFVAMGAQDAADYFADPRLALEERTFRDPAGFEQVCAEQGRRTDAIPTSWVYFQCTHGRSDRDSHELRLASEERISGMFDYVIGALYDHTNPESRLTQETPILASTSPPRIGLVNLTPIIRNSESTEKSVFANLTAHIGEKWEFSGGARYIDYRNFSSIITGTTRPTPDQHEQANATVFTGSAQYSLSDDVMAYATVGTSWRPGAFAVGDFNLQPTPREVSFYDLSAEESTSYELGLKTSFLDGRGRMNVAVFRQEFDDYVYRGPPVYYINYAQQGGVVRPAVSSFNFVADVPATVDGVEIDGSFQILPRWNVGANIAYADGQIEDGRIACTDLDSDGVPDVNAPLPTREQLQAAVGAGENVSECQFSGRASLAPKWSANLQTEAGFTLAHWSDAFVRALYTYYTDTEGDPNNTLDDVSAYGIFNLYTGLRDPDGKWEVSLFAKNLFETEEVLSRGGAPLSSTVRTFTGSLNHTAPYYAVTTTTPREFGISFRVALGSR